MYTDLMQIKEDTIVFEIDDNSFRGMARFARALDECRAMGVIKGPITVGTGAWEGTISPCYALCLADWQRLPRSVRDFAANQACFLRLMPTGGRVLADLINQRGAPVDQLGFLWEVELGELAKLDGYTLIGNRAYVASRAVPKGARYVPRSAELQAGDEPVTVAERGYVEALARYLGSVDNEGFSTQPYPIVLERLVNLEAAE